MPEQSFTYVVTVRTDTKEHADQVMYECLAPVKHLGFEYGITSDDAVWVLTIDHRHGTDVSLHATERSAKDALTGYVDNWWAEEFGDTAAPGDDQERVAEYFERVNDEGYTILRSDITANPVVTSG